MSASLSVEEKAKLADVKAELEQSVKGLVEAGRLSAEAAGVKLEAAVKAMSDEIIALKSKFAPSVEGLEQKEASKFSFAKAGYAIASKNWDRAGLEKDILTATAKAQTIDPGTAGGVMVPTQVSSSIIDILQARSVLAQMGTTQLNLTGIGKFQLPRKTAVSTAYWLGELDAITPSSLAFDNVQLDPKKVAALVTMSKELIADANQSIEQIVRTDIARQLALAIDNKGILGDGTSDTPIGIINTPNISTYAVAADGDPANYATFEELIALLEDENALEGKLGFLGHPKIFRALRRQTVAQWSGQAPGEGEPLFLPIISDMKLAEILGYGIGKTTNIPATGTKGTGTALSQLIFGNFEDLVQATWGGLMIDASDTAGDNFAKYAVQIRAVARVDFAIRQPKSFAVATDIMTTL